MKHITSRICSIETLESRTLLSLAAVDVSFSGDGTQTYPFMDSQVTSASAFDVQRDGKIVLAGVTFGSNRIGQILLARLNPNGTLDGSFGKDGKIITHFARKDIAVATRAGALQVQGDGKILIAGSYGGKWAVFRFNSDGSPDKSFDRDGVKQIKTLWGSEPSQIELLRGDRILIGGAAQNNPAWYATDFVLARLNSNGSIDRSFGKNGSVVSDYEFGDRSMVVGVDGQGNIAMAGLSNSANTPLSLVVERYKPNGARDTSFADSGRFKITVDGFDSNLSSLRLLSDGRILLSGKDQQGAMLMRLTKRGGLDSSFGDAGVRHLNHASTDVLILRAGGNLSTVLAIAQNTDSLGVGQDTSQVLLRLRDDGSDDPAFVQRYLNIDSDLTHQLQGGARLLKNNNVLALFTSKATFADGDLSMARFDAGGALDDQFGKNGATTTDDTGPLRATPLRVLSLADGSSLVLTQLDMYDYQTRYKLLRLLSDGKLDTSFKVPVEAANFGAVTIALDSAGKILLSVNNDLQRLNADGSADKSFGANGKIALSEDTSGQIYPIAGQKFYMVGGSGGMGSFTAIITRFNANGSIDKSFGQSGAVTVNLDNQNFVDHLLVDSGGKLTVVGTSSTYQDLGSPLNQRTFIIRYNANGALDTSFSQDGRVLIDNLLGTSDARLVPGGGLMLLVPSADARGLAIVRYKADGSLQSTVNYQAGKRIDWAFFDTDGRIIVVTASSTIRLAADGSKIPGAAAGPALPVSLISAGYSLSAVRSITADHKMMLAGADADGDLTVWRFLLD
jgi:uncharacterized delta-60 repeat protein